MKQILLACVVAATLFACQQPEKAMVASAQTIDMEAAKKAIDAADAKFASAMAAGDSATIAGMYHSQALVMPPNMALFTNPSMMGSFVKEVPKLGVKKMTLQPVELLNGGDYVIERSVWEISDGAKTLDKGKAVVVWKQEGGEWKLYRDIWNSDNPPLAK